MNLIDLSSADCVRKCLTDIYDRLLGEFGERNWWPAKTPFEVMVGAILTQNTAWTNVEKAIHNLDSTGLLTAVSLAEIPLEELEHLIRPSGYFRQKAQRLKLFAGYLVCRHGGEPGRLFSRTLEEVREELLRQQGIGPETADSILLYAGHLPTFVVDAYTLRIFTRLGILSGSERYAEIRSLFMDHLPHNSQMFNEYHALIVAHGKIFCKKRKPACPACPLQDICAFAAEALSLCSE